MDTTKLTDSFTVFFYPFKASRDFYLEIQKNHLWCLSDQAPDRSSLFPHIHSFFSSNAEKSIDKINPNQGILYELKSGELKDGEKKALFLYNVFFRRKCKIKIDDSEIEFTLSRNLSMLSPKIFFVPSAGVGFLIFGIGLEKGSQDLSSLLELNYRLKAQIPGSIQTIHTDRRLHEKASQQEQEVEDLFSEMPDTWIDDTRFQWNVKNYINYLFDGLEDQIEPLSPHRVPALTYASMKDELEEIVMREQLFRLRRLYSEKYIPSTEAVITNTETIHDFEKVYYGASVEGACILIRPDDTPFFSNYGQTVLQRTLWIYLLVMFQRFALIEASSNIDGFLDRKGKDDENELNELINRIASLLLKCRIYQVSHQVQINQIYELYRENLGVEKLYREVSEGVEMLRNKGR
jgi:hypothetical protein